MWDSPSISSAGFQGQEGFGSGCALVICSEGQVGRVGLPGVCSVQTSQQQQHCCILLVSSPKTTFQGCFSSYKGFWLVGELVGVERELILPNSQSKTDFYLPWKVVNSFSGSYKQHLDYMHQDNLGLSFAMKAVKRHF